MSAPGTDQSPSSISSSGHVDGLGRRLLAFDRETGAILERLHLRPELAAFESAIRDRIDQLAALDDERFARPGSVERDPSTGDLTVLSEFVAGSRLSDLLETAEDGGNVPGVDVALGFLLEALPALGSFHSAMGSGHGLIAPPRMVLTPAGQVVFLDPAFGSVVERLGMSRARLWTQLEIAAAPGQGPVRLDPAADVAQVALSAVMLVIGRRLREHEYPDALQSLLSEVAEVAQIRGSSAFASGLQRLLQRALPIAGAQTAVTADELASDIRLLLRREIGVDVCRQALVDFTEQMDAAFADARAAADDDHQPPAAIGAGAGDGPDFDIDRLTLEALDTFEVLDVEDPDPIAAAPESGDDQEEEFEEIPLDPGFLDERDLPPPARREPEPEPILFEEEPIDEPGESPAHTRSGAGDADESLADVAPAPPKEVADPWSFDAAAADRAAVPEPARADHFDEPALETATPDAAGHAEDDSGAGIAEPLPGPEPSESTASAEPDPAAEPSPAEEPFPASSRRKKRQHKSARARKDKLRSVADAKPQPKPPEARPQGGWLVNPDRAAAFAPPVPMPPAPQPAAVIGHAAPVPIPVQAAAPLPPPVPQPPPSAPAPIPMPVYGSPSAPASAPAAPPAPIVPKPAPPPALKPPASAGAPLRLKEQPPSGFTPPRTSGAFAAGYVHREPRREIESPRRFPWKLALGLLVIVAAAIVAGRTYLPPSPAGPDEEAGVESAAADPREPAVVVMPKIETGHITIETQPAGARVLLDGKPVGESPLKLADVPAGRHTLTLISSSGQVTRTVEVEPGRTAAVDASIFSGWVAIFAPVVLDVAVNGRSIGTTERERVMLAAGRHILTLTNKELGYKTMQTVQVEPGEVRSITLDPRGPVSFNASPWAEVWLDGKKLGDTPLANVQVPIGIQEFVFRHPDHGERKVTATIRANGSEPVSVDFLSGGSGLALQTRSAIQHPPAGPEL